MGTLRVLTGVICLCSLLFLASDAYIFQTLSAIVDVSGLVIGATGIALDIKNLIENQQELSEKIDRSLFALQKHISEENKKLYISLFLDTLFDRLERLSSCVENGQQELTYMVKANPNETQAYQTEFLNHAPDAFRCARELPNLFLATVPGEENKGLSFVAEKHRCSSSALKKLKTFVYNTVYVGMVTEFTYKSLKYNVSLGMEIEYWTYRLQSVSWVFLNQTEVCKQQFDEILEEDIHAISDANKLHLNLTERYFDVWTDVHISRSEIVWYVRSSINETIGVMALKVDDRVTMVTYGETDSEMFKTNRSADLEHIKNNAYPVGNAEPGDICKGMADNLCEKNFSVVLCMEYNTDSLDMTSAKNDDSPAHQFTQKNTDVYLLVQDLESVEGTCEGGDTLLKSSLSLVGGVSAATSHTSDSIMILTLTLAIIMFI